MSRPKLLNQVALVTGSSSGLGRAISIALAREGAKLVVCADLVPTSNVGAKFKEEEPTHELICRTHGQKKAMWTACDITVESDVQAAVKLAVEKGGRLDVLVNNAGAGPEACLLHTLDAARFDSIIKLNIQGTFNGCKHALAQFMKQGLDSNGQRGRIVNIASAAGLRSVRTSAAYCASKTAVIGLTKSLALDYGPHKVHVNAVCPGFFHSGMTQDIFENAQVMAYMKASTPYWTTEDNLANVVEATLFLASPDATWVTGVALPVDGGATA